MMIGRIKKFNFRYLFFLIALALLISSYFLNNYNSIFVFFIFFFIGLLLTKYGLIRVKKLNLLQNIRENGPTNHLQKKDTPTMGGLFIVIPFLLLLIIISFRSEDSGILFILLNAFNFFIIGFLDDYLSIKQKQSRGLKSIDKFLLQSLSSIFFLILISQKDYINPLIEVSNNWSINTNILIFPICFMTLVGLSNAVNLTDGLDGLAAGCSSIAFYGLGTEILLKGQKDLMIYSLICYAMAGLCMGFLKFNKNPAKIFMGDTGSLTIGATLGSISILTNSFFVLFIFSGIFIIEALSVVIQVSFFKITKRFFQNGKRVFLMTPIHHHFELKGIKEEDIVENFWKINTILVILGIVLKIIL